MKKSTMLDLLVLVIRRDLVLAMRRRADVLTTLILLVLGKMAAHWMVSGLPLVLMAPVLGLQFDMPVEALGVLIAGLLLGTPILSMVGAIGAALTLGLRGGGVLLSLRGV